MAFTTRRGLDQVHVPGRRRQRWLRCMCLVPPATVWTDVEGEKKRNLKVFCGAFRRMAAAPRLCQLNVYRLKRRRCDLLNCKSDRRRRRWEDFFGDGASTVCASILSTTSHPPAPPPLQRAPAYVQAAMKGATAPPSGPPTAEPNGRTSHSPVAPISTSRLPVMGRGYPDESQPGPRSP